MEEQPNLEQGPEPQTESRKIADVLRKYGEDYGFDPETCDEIAKMPFDEAFETAFGYFAQAGLEPEEVLVEFLEPDPQP